jgi:hypothetical protein
VSVANAFRRLRAPKPESNLVAFARRELMAAGMDPDAKDDGPNKWMAAGTLQLLEAFADQGHSGMSAPYAIQVFSKLAAFEPLGPLTGADNEWMEVSTGVFQNLRCGHVFKQADRFDGQPYDIEGRIFREPNGACFQNADSCVPITFPYTPKREYVDVPADRE